MKGGRERSEPRWLREIACQDEEDTCEGFH